VIRLSVRLLIAAALTLTVAPAAFAQADEDDSVLRPSEPDVTLVGLPTAMRLPQWGSLFRITHRFNGSLDNGALGDMFGLDEGAKIGLEYRIGIVKGGQVGVYRTSDKTIQFFGQYGVFRQSGSSPVEVAALASIEGTNNFQDSYSPALGAIISHRIREVVALYAEPIWVNNSNAQPSELVDDNDTFMLGIGARLRFRPTVYVVFEMTPRVSGNAPGSTLTSFAIEKRAGGHVFQLNVGNGNATTPGQIARGATDYDNWYLGFNLSRKFY
jgi:Membrane bound beta barrel domain (DUF5777)